MKDRVLQIIEHEGLSPASFAERIGIQRATMTHIISGRNNPSLEVTKKILQTFQYLNPEWLILGLGNMFRSGSTSYGKEESKGLGLFDNTPIFTAEVQAVPEYRKEKDVNSPVNNHKHPETEVVIPKTIVSKKVSKIVIFYSDDTFETFVPEKNKKD